MCPLSILVVDDDGDSRRCVRGLLEYAGYLATTASNGLEALAAIDEHHFDLVITDILMPEMDGLELIIRIRERRPYTRILAVSGGGSFLTGPLCTKLADDLGAEASITKPLSEDTLLRGVDLALTRPIVA